MLTLISIFASSLSAAPRTVLTELFTNTGCIPCGEANPALDEIFSRHPTSMAVIRYHVNWPYPYDPFYLENPTENSARVAYYGVGSVPNLRVDGVINGGYQYENWESLILQRAQQPAPLTLTLVVTLDTLTGTGTLQTTLSPESPVSSSHLRLRYVLVEDNVFYEATNGETLHQQVMRKMIPSTEGVPLPPLTPGQTLQDSQVFQVESSWDPRNLEVVAFVQDDSTREVHQAARRYLLPLPRIRFHHYTIQDPDGLPEPGETFPLSLYVVNVGRGPAEGLVISLDALTPFLIITPSALSFDSLDIGDIGTSQQPYQVAISASAPDSFGTWIHLTATSADGSTSQDSFFFLVDLTPGLFEDGEHGDSMWRRYGGYGIWHLTDHRAHSPTHSWYSGIEGAWYYFNDADLSLESPYFLVGPNTALHFWQWYQLEANADFGYIEVTQNGWLWTRLDQVTQSSNGWTETTYDLSPYTGTPIKIRFRLVTDEDVALEGWYLDDISTEQVQVRENPVAVTPLRVSLSSVFYNEGPVLYFFSPIPGVYRVRIYRSDGVRIASSSLEIPSAQNLWTVRLLPQKSLPSGVYWIHVSGPVGQPRIFKVLYLDEKKE